MLSRNASNCSLNTDLSRNWTRMVTYLVGGNGIIQLGNKCKIISKFHEHTINKFSPVKAIPFDPKIL